ncbi:NADH-quinone oxidoreductase subunit N [Amorphoplanes digitatis]|uniref:NADH-quinone oxidoreductase subunit N n=1 Tax=Actinoplanes digitatis TaxID=1868 RepID=A0A7W7MUA6_9ACTN|nr:proton-conducting transporter membrane subunit [Actinoplanes digitatis]MBB4766597.1 NADH-quinone oxidoreductase subunit N [Actinoplanes digitatis]GID96996.1 NADH-quinone oxidoreductase subunit N [Actinoplanes digitatis]
MIQSVNHFALLPLYAAAGTALLVLVLELAVGRWVAPAGIAGGLATIGAAVTLALDPADTFCGPARCSWVATPPAAVMAVLFAALTIGVLALSAPALRLGIAPAGEFCFLLTSSMAGGVVVAYAGDLITLIVGLETLTLPLYVLVGLRRFAPRERGTTAGASAAVTFFLVSVVSTALALLGAALLYASTGALHLAELTGGAGQFAPLASVGAALLVIGFAFKVAAVPLHAWAPATYDGAPIPVAAYLSTASKLGGVIALAAVAQRLDTGPLVAVLAVLTMTVGNLVALRQTRMIRLLAWSSVAQAGYILAPLAAGASGVPAALAYAVFFVLLEFVAFGVVVALRGPGGDGGDLAEYRSAGRHHPWLGAALVLSFAGLAGLPPGLAGLFAKVTIVASLIDDGWGWLAGVVALNAVIALAYYVRVAASLYAPVGLPPEPVPAAEPGAVATLTRVDVSRPVGAAVAVATLLTVILGFAPQWVFDALS